MTSGPIGHKPTYSASFVTSIGSHNAQRIRTLVAHSTNPARLTQWYLRNWITSFGLDPSRVKVLAVSLSLPRKNPDLHQHHQHHYGNGSAHLTAVPVVGSTGAYVLTVPVNLPGIHNAGGANNTAGVVATSNSTNAGTVIQVDVNMADAKKQMIVESDFDIAARQMEGWLERRPRKDVAKLVALTNTDLRANDLWLVYVSPAMKQKVGL
jgi:hypothetical protein